MEKLDETVEKALQTLEGCALRNMQEFEPQGLSNTLHIMAKTKYSNVTLLHALVRRTEETAADFNAKDVANTLWALATLSKMKVTDCKQGFSASVAQSGDRLIELGDPVLERVLGLLDWRVEVTAGYPLFSLYTYKSTNTDEWDTAAHMNVQELTNTMWAFAVMKRVRDGVLRILEARAEEIIGYEDTYIAV
jgi:hypothetical protein